MFRYQRFHDYEPTSSCEAGTAEGRRLRLLRRSWEEPGCLPCFAFLAVLCTGLTVVALGLVLIAHNPSNQVSVSLGAAFITTSAAIIVLAGVLTVCRADYTWPDRQTSGSSSPSDLASTRL